MPAEWPFFIVAPGDQEATEPVVITRAVQTCVVCPSQWDAWDDRGRYFYLRHRNGRGSVDTFASEDPETWGAGAFGEVARFHGQELPEGADDLEELAAFCGLAGITLADDVQLTTYAQHIAQGVARERRDH